MHYRRGAASSAVDVPCGASPAALPRKTTRDCALASTTLHFSMKKRSASSSVPPMRRLGVTESLLDDIESVAS